MAEYDGPRSLCNCDHTGDGPNSQHSTRESGKGLSSPSFDEGHGKCNVEGCTCGCFTWKGFSSEYHEFLKEQATEWIEA